MKTFKLTPAQQHALDAINAISDSTYKGKNLIQEIIRESLEHAEVIAEYKKLYPGASVAILFECDTISDYKVWIKQIFDTREELHDYARTYNIPLSTAIKSAYIKYSTKTARTRYTYNHINDDLNIDLIYDRDGLPSPNCKIVTETTFAITCDMPED